MANLLQSSQTQETKAPAYYTDYLSNLASSGTQAATGAQYADANALQTGAFGDVTNAASAYQPTLDAAGTTLGNAGDSTSPLSAASSYLTAAGTNPANAATGYMSPYIQDVVNSIGDIGQRNIIQNLAPQATAGAVGSGQFGSTRGAQVLGQTIQNANQDILKSQREALNTGYNTALDTANKQNALNAQLGSTAGNLASQGQTNLTNLGAQQGQLASTNQALNLADINARATLGEQQRTIAQNKQLFPLSNLSTLSTILRGYNVPTSTRTTAEMSPLAALAGVGTGALGLITPGTNGVTPLQNIKNLFNGTSNNGVADIGSGLTVNADGSVSGGSNNTDSGLSNNDLYAQSLGYANAADMNASQASNGIGNAE